MKRIRIAALLLAATVLASTVTAVIGVSTGSPANAADVIAIGNYASAAPQLCAEPSGGWNGAVVVLRPCTGATAQAWARVSVGGGHYYMINQAHPSMCMDVRDGKNGDGTIQIWSCTNTDGMKWSFHGVLWPNDRIKSRLYGNARCLDVAGAATEGRAVMIHSCDDGQPTQVWTIR